MDQESKVTCVADRLDDRVEEACVSEVEDAGMI